MSRPEFGFDGSFDQPSLPETPHRIEIEPGAETRNNRKLVLSDQEKAQIQSILGWYLAAPLTDPVTAYDRLLPRFTEPIAIGQWFDEIMHKVEHESHNYNALVEQIHEGNIAKVIVLSHGRFDEIDGQIIAPPSEECADRIEQSLTAIDTALIGSATEPPTVLLAGASQQLDFMELTAKDFTFWLQNHEQIQIEQLDCQPFPECNTRTQFEAIAQEAARMLMDPAMEGKKIAVTSGDYHVARCLLYLMRWVPTALRDRVEIYGLPWAFDEEKDPSEREALLAGEKTRCIQYSARKVNDGRGDLARPWED